MKIPVQDFKSALTLFEAEFIGTMKTSFQKFLAGAALAASGNQIDAMIAKFVTPDGLFDVDAFKALIDAGMKQCGGEFVIPVNFGALGALGASPVDLKIDLSDVEKFFKQTLPAVSRYQTTEEEA